MVKSFSSLGVLLVATITFAYLSFFTVTQLIDNNGLVVHTNEVIAQTNRVQANLFESDALLLRYIITKNERTKVEYDHQIEKTQKEIHYLAKITEDNQYQAAKTSELSQAYEKRIAFQQNEVLKDSIKVGDSKNNQLRLNVVGLTEDINKEEYRLLKERLKGVERTAFSLSFVLGFGTLLLVGFAFNAGTYYNESMRRSNLNKFMHDMKINVGRS